MTILVALLACSKGNPVDGIESGSFESVVDTPLESAAKDIECPASFSTAGELEGALVGSWEGTVYSYYHEAEVSMEFGSDGSFFYSHPEDPLGDRPYEGGETFQVLSPSLILVRGSKDPDPEDADIHSRFLQSVNLTEACELSFYSPGYTIFTESIESAMVLQKQE